MLKYSVTAFTLALMYGYMGKYMLSLGVAIALGYLFVMRVSVPKKDPIVVDVPISTPKLSVSDDVKQMVPTLTDDEISDLFEQDKAYNSMRTMYHD